MDVLEACLICQVASTLSLSFPFSCICGQAHSPRGCLGGGLLTLFAECQAKDQFFLPPL